jgi:hypothetical protein
MRRNLVSECAVIAAIALVLVAPAGAQASARGETKAEIPAAAKNNPGISLDVIRSLPAELRNNRTLVVDPRYKIGAPIILPDGTPVAGQSAAAMAAAVTCGGTVVAPLTGSWSGASKSNCAVFGSPGYYLSYSWSRSPTTETLGCVQGQSHTFDDHGDPITVWKSLGCGIHGGASVFWGNVLAYPRVRAKTEQIPAGFVAAWRH